MNLCATDGPAHTPIQTQPKTVESKMTSQRRNFDWSYVRTTAYPGGGYRCGRSTGRGNTVVAYFAELLSLTHFADHSLQVGLMSCDARRMAQTKTLDLMLHEQQVLTAGKRRDHSTFIVTPCHIQTRYRVVLSCNRTKASWKTRSPESTIWYFLFQTPVSSPCSSAIPNINSFNVNGIRYSLPSNYSQ
jgi:hypothetical protein